MDAERELLFNKQIEVRFKQDMETSQLDEGRTPEGEPLLKRPREDPKHEFDLDGSKIVPARYERMEIEGLLTMSAVEPKCREMIAKNQFFELFHLHKVDDLDFTHQHILTDTEDSDGCSLTVSSGSVKTQQPKSRPDFFQLLYSFGQFYLQLDTSICRFFVQRPQLNWDITHPEINCFIKDADIEVTKLNAAGKQNSKLKPGQRSKSSRRSSTYHANNGQYHPYLCNNYYSGGNRGQNNATTSNDPRDCHCHNYNWRQCIDDPRCFKDRVCYYCGEPGHKAPQCPRGNGNNSKTHSRCGYGSR